MGITHCHFVHTFGYVFPSVGSTATSRSARTERRRGHGTVRGQRVKGQHSQATTPWTRIGTRSSRRWSGPAERTVTSAATSGLGDGVARAAASGAAGHTDGDLVVRMPDGDGLVGGETSIQAQCGGAGGRAPLNMFPNDLPHSMDVVLGLNTSASVVGLCADGRGPLGRACVEAPAHRLRAGGRRPAAPGPGQGVRLDGAFHAGTSSRFPPTASAHAGTAKVANEQLGRSAPPHRSPGG